MDALPQPLPPVPVQPIAYSTPVNQRPALITAIGVISIVVASLTMLFNGIAGLQAFGMVMLSTMSRAAATAQQAATVAAQAPPLPKPVDPLSMPVEDRQTVLRGLANHRQITKPRGDQLDALLATHGRQIFRLHGPNLTVSVVQENVTESGQLPDAKGGEGSDFFIVGEGRIELADDHAKFVPDDGRETVRVSAAQASELANWQIGLTAEQVRGITNHIEAQTRATLPAPLKLKLEGLLNSPAQGLFETAPTVHAVTSQLRGVSYVIANGTTDKAGGAKLTLSTREGMLVLDEQGNTLVDTTTLGGGGGGGAFAGPTFNVNMTAAVTAMACALLSLGLAIYLLVIGILMLRQHPRAGRLHKIYAWLKIPLAVAGGIAWVTLWMSFAAGVGGTVPAVTSAGAVTGCAIAVFVGCAYPVALLLALRTQSVREYYAAVR